VEQAEAHRSVSAQVPRGTWALAEPGAPVRSMIRDHNFAPGNTGYVFWFDILAPVLLIVLYIATG
jgi:hypothetical protein